MEHEMKITTWNVNGFRAVLKKDFINSVHSLAPDILCLQELKAKEEQLIAEDILVPGYDYLWNSATRPGYSGVGTYIKKSLNINDHSTGLGVDEFDVEGRVIQTRFGNTVLFNIYFPNGQRGQERVDYKLRFYARLLDICNEEHEKGRNIIITGDFNTAHNEIDLANPKENSKISGFLPEERVWIDKFLENGFTDAFRKLYPEKVQYTWWTYRVNARARGIGWRLDYFLISNLIYDRVIDVTIFDQIQGSDHCPVTLEIMD
jgi:exodeoxyribonuclease-3